MVLTQPWGWWTPSRGSSYVSIPLWFLRNSPAPHSVWTATSSFHTTMVLTQRRHNGGESYLKGWFPYHYGSYATKKTFQISDRSNQVSIPLWFLRNWQSSLTSMKLPRVSIPLWFLRNGSLELLRKDAGTCFHTTMVLTQPKQTSPEEEWRNVSIPLWFLRNRYQRDDTDSWRVVSIPLWFLRNSNRRRRRPKSNVVSIPLWFLRNDAAKKHLQRRKSKFPYHYGSYATEKP